MVSKHQDRSNGGTFFSASMCLTIINLIERDKLNFTNNKVLLDQLNRVKESVNKEMDYIHKTVSDY